MIPTERNSFLVDEGGSIHFHVLDCWYLDTRGEEWNMLSN